MSEEDTEKYIETILSLRKKYSGTIDILLGTERDFLRTKTGIHTTIL